MLVVAARKAIIDRLLVKLVRLSLRGCEKLRLRMCHSCRPSVRQEALL